MTAATSRGRWARMLRGGPAAVVRAVRLRLRVLRLELVNRVGRRPVVGGADVVVSLTTYGARARRVHLAVESIGGGSVRPRELVLWLDDERLLAALPRTLRRLQARGLQIRPCTDVGPHKKYHPYVQGTPVHRRALVTADDDTLYPGWWLERLVAAHDQRPSGIHGLRGRRVVAAAEGLAPYEEWPLATTDQPAAATFLTGVSGIIYPPEFLTALAGRGDAFLATSARADDVWLHAVAVEEGFLPRQIGTSAEEFPEVPGSAATGLLHSNVTSRANDAQIAATHPPAVRELVRASAVEQARAAASVTGAPVSAAPSRGRRGRSRWRRRPTSG